MFSSATSSSPPASSLNSSSSVSSYTGSSSSEGSILCQGPSSSSSRALASSISASISTCVKYRLTRVCDRVLIRPRVKTSSCSSFSSLLSSTGFLVQKCLDAQRFIQAQVQKGPRG